MIVGRTIRCILFDLGSTLWQHKDQALTLASERASNRFAASVFRHYAGSDVFPGIDGEALGELLRKGVEKQIRTRARQHPGYEPDFAQAAMEALQDAGMPKADCELGEAIYEALRVRIPDSRSLFADTCSTLATLKERGYILGVVTNRHYGGVPFHEDLQAMGLLDYFDLQHMAISADLGIRKPHPAIFLHALHGLNVAPQAAAMVGDSLKADIVGARMLNMLAIWMPKASLREEVKGNDLFTYVSSREIEKGHYTPEMLKPDAIIERLSDLLDLPAGSATS
jgi:HAD superfamily hydrolase (TIGR01549 family)